ncbi:MAG: hypothetical protein JNN17_23305 [Verrucomicrobiaceae bacterium]|nr:hypothetical protein [Verrucomicrobiaceae bacterium]
MKLYPHLICLLLLIYGAMRSHGANLLPDFSFPNADSKKLATGDMSVLSKYQGNIPALWYVFDASSGGEYGTLSFPREGRNEQEQVIRVKAYNKELKEKVAEMLSSTPGHADYIGGVINKISSLPEESARRIPIERYFEALARLKTPECVQTMMRFIDDERQVGYFTPCGPSSRRPPNWSVMLHELGLAVGKSFNQPIARMWWDSPAASEFWPPEKLKAYEQRKREEEATLLYRLGLPLADSPLWKVLGVIALLGAAIAGAAHFRKSRQPPG